MNRFQQVDEIFGIMRNLLMSPSQENQFQHLEYKPRLPKDAEVPRQWLQSSSHLKTWNDFTFTCEDHCGKKFPTLHELINHNYEQKNVTKNRILCNHCNKSFNGIHTLATIINHIIKETKYEHMKYCCIICSKVFYNVPYLSTHYQEHHPGSRLRMYLCLKCGVCCQDLQKLRFHKQWHDDQQ